MSSTRSRLTFLLTLFCLLVASGFTSARAQTSGTACVSCHGDPDQVDDLSIVAAFEEDVHRQVGLSCADCHGGNPDPSVADDMDASMDEDFAAHPFVGAPDRGEIPGWCGRCHSDPNYMKRFRPDARVDQETEYWTSQHGRALREGDENVATCVDCHGAHGIQHAADPRSSVYPTRIAETCRGCHADASRMEGYTLEDGRPLPVDQYARWRRSVHAAAMFEKEDLTAPTCNDCHGNHGATPPGLTSIAFVCGQCHGREAELFRASPKHEGFLEHHDYLEEAGDAGCAECHEVSESGHSRTAPHGFAECNACHGNHAIIHPTVAMLAPLPITPCAFCHEPPASVASLGFERDETRARYEEKKTSLMEAAQAQGLSGTEQFDWLVDQALALETHTRPSEAGTPELRPEFERLFRKFRIGKTYFTYEDPISGETARGEVVRCSDCHAAPVEESESTRAAQEFVAHMQELTALTAQAERILLFARRGGVETREAMTDLDQAVDAQIELEVLVHTFAADSSGTFAKKHEEGIEHARAALLLGEESLLELGNRRRGLVVALVLICVVVLGLGWRIRQLGT